MKKSFLTFLILTITFFSHSVYANDFFKDKDKSQLIQFLSNHTDNPYCYIGGETGTAPSQVFRFDKKIYIFYTTAGYKEGISQCYSSNGAVNWQARLAQLENSDVSSFDLFEKLPDNINRAFIENVKITPNGIMTFTTGEYDTNDYPIPTLKYQYKVKLPSMQILSSNFLGKCLSCK